MRDATAVDAPVIEAARAALLETTPADTVGEVAGVDEPSDGVVDVHFATTLPGYPGWTWTVSVSVVDGDGSPSVLELGLLPGEGALVAPDWVPWSERLAEYRAAQQAKESEDGSEEQLSEEEDDLDSEVDEEDLLEDGEDELDADVDEEDLLGDGEDELDGIEFESAAARHAPDGDLDDDESAYEDEDEDDDDLDDTDDLDDADDLDEDDEDDEDDLDEDDDFDDDDLDEGDDQDDVDADEDRDAGEALPGHDGRL